MDLTIHTLRQIRENPVKEPLWLIDGLIGVGDASMLIGDWGTGKSYLLFHMGLCLAAGDDFLGHRLRQSRVLYLDREMNYRLGNYRLNMLLNGVKGRWDDVPFHYCNQPNFRINDKTGQGLLELVQEYDVIILDSYRGFSEGNEKEATDVRKLWNALLPFKAQDKTVILTHHLRKRYQNDESSLGERASGSTDICAGADSVLGLEKLADTDRSLLTSLSPVKDRWDGLGKTIKLRCEWRTGEWSTISLKQE